MKTLILIIAYCLLLTAYCFPQHNETDTLSVANNGTLSDSTDLGNFKLLALEFPATMTSDTVFVQDKNTDTGTFDDVYFLSSSGTKTRVHIVVQAGKKVMIHPLMTFGLGRYVRFVTDDAEGGARVLVAHKGYFD